MKVVVEIVELQIGKNGRDLKERARAKERNGLCAGEDEGIKVNLSFSCQK